MSKATQCQRVVDYMNEFGGITQLEALNELGACALRPEFPTCAETAYRSEANHTASQTASAKHAGSSDTAS